MRETTIARNYAEALLALAQKAGDAPGWGELVSALATAVQEDARLHRFLEAPQVGAAQKKAILSRALSGRAPRTFILFLDKLVDNRRQLLLPAVALEYQNLLDEALGRVHAEVTVAREVDDATRKTLAEELSRNLGRQVIPHVVVNPAILGGVVVRVGDAVMDGSVRRRLSIIRRQMLSAPQAPSSTTSPSRKAEPAGAQR